MSWNGEGKTNSFDLVIPIDLKSYVNWFSLKRACSISFHRDIDKTGGLNYQYEKNLFGKQAFFGIVKRTIKNPFE